MKVHNSKQNQSYIHMFLYFTTSDSVLFLYYTKLYAYVDDIIILFFVR